MKNAGFLRQYGFVCESNLQFATWTLRVAFIYMPQQVNVSCGYVVFALRCVIVVVIAAYEDGQLGFVIPY